jgi:hypothetical protein
MIALNESEVEGEGEEEEEEDDEEDDDRPVCSTYLLTSSVTLTGYCLWFPEWIMQCQYTVRKSGRREYIQHHSPDGGNRF